MNAVRIVDSDEALQTKPPRVLQEREVDRLGGGHPVSVNVRAIATSNRDLGHPVRAERAPLPERRFLPEGVPIDLASLERLAIQEALRRMNGNRTHAARVLGISLRTLRNKLRGYRDARAAALAAGQILPSPAGGEGGEDSEDSEDSVTDSTSARSSHSDLDRKEDAA